MAEQRAHASASYANLATPREEVYAVADREVAARLGVSPAPDG